MPSNRAISGPGIFSDRGFLANSAVAVALTGSTTETVLASIVIPAGSLRKNGRLVADLLATFTGSTNAKTIRARLGGTGIDGTVVWSTTTSTAGNVGFKGGFAIQNRGNEAIQIGEASANSGAGFQTAALQNATVDTTAEVTLYITGQLASSGETLTLERIAANAEPLA